MGSGYLHENRPARRRPRDVTVETIALLDACVLVPAPLRDTLLRLAESPRLYTPRWSEEILAETRRTLTGKIGLSEKQATHLETELRRHFPDALVSGHDHLILRARNDRHVLAAAVKTGARTDRDLQPKALSGAHPQTLACSSSRTSRFLCALYEADSDTVVRRLREQADNIGISISEQLNVLHRAVPTFVDLVRASLPARQTR
jgi:hypothetical protein